MIHAMPTKSSRVFNIPASAPFLPTLISALLDGKLVPGFPAAGDPLALAQATLYLPTRRACRLAREEFLKISDGDAAILPRIAAIGDIDEDEIVFAEAATGALAQAALELPETIAPLERRLLLAELIAKWASSRALTGAQGTPLVANTPSSALALADDLARLIDDMTTRGVSWDKLDGLVRETHEELDKFWQFSLEFLKIARAQWPQHLADNGLIAPAERRDKLIEAETQRLQDSNAPVIAAGSTGSMPATAKLLATIAQLPHGAVVLPGLDIDLDDASWRGIAGGGDKSEDNLPASGHPQFALQALLTRIGIARSAVMQLAPGHGREAFVSEAMRPAMTTDLWQKSLKNKDFSAKAEAATAALMMIEAANAEDEALAVAVALREAIETPGKTAALVTSDRALARRVLAALDRWNVLVDDSGGDALANTPAGLFARLTAETALGGLEPVTLLALLKHPLLRLGAGHGAHHRAIAALERAVLRGPRPKPGSAGLAHALTTYEVTRKGLHPRDPRGFIGDADLVAAKALLATLHEALAPLESLKPGRHQSLASLAKLHCDVVVVLASDGTRDNTAFGGADGRKLEAAFDDLINTPAAASVSLAVADYAEMFETIAAAATVRMREQANVRIRIFGPLEARLQSIDRMVLGGLNEVTWPPETRSDPWLSRPMRRALGLNLPELRIGLTAHDFAQALGAPEVILTRAAKVAGTPTVTSRFVQRLAALAGEPRWKQVLARGEKYLGLARALDEPDAAPKSAERPAPKPPRAARPTKLSVTDIEHWLRDPYTIYAKHVLDLHPLDAVDTPPGAADRGSVIHEAIGNFTRQFSAALPADPETELTALGKQSFARLDDYPEARAFWWPRFKRIARWFAEWERQRRPSLDAVHGEIRGTLEIPLRGGPFMLTARADRIEQRKDGSYAILDYKTGAPPTEPQVRTGLAPQLTLEAAILRGGGFENVTAGSVAEISYVRLQGGDPPGEPKEIQFKQGTPDSQADDALKKLTTVVIKFLVESEPYRSLVHPMWKKHYGEYDHLARVKEWAASGGESEAEP
jgi:ATP-dependent helicase/nuclease subunit B